MFGRYFLLLILPFSLCASLKAIRLIDSRDQLNAEGYEKLEGIEIDMDLPGKSTDLCKRLDRFICQTVDEELISQIKKEILQFYRKHHRPIVAVIHPQQEDSGVLQLIVVEGRVGEIDVRGNCYFSACRLKRYLDLEPGDSIRSDSINKGLLLINRNPFRQADLVYKQGRESGTTDLELVVQDFRPARLYGGFDNTGNSVTGNNRIFAGFNWGNAFSWDHLLSFQFTASDDFKSFLGYVGKYTIPLPIKHILSVYGGYSTVDSKFDIPEAVGIKFRNSGYNAQGSFRYDIPFNPIYSYLQEFSCGFDFKRMNNNLEFGGIPVFSKNVNLFQFMLSYNMGYESKKFVATLEAEGFISPFQWLPDQSNATYQTLRPFAKSRYVYGRASFSFIHYFLPWLQYDLFIRGQAADANLLPSEEYGVGGYDTVRGYQEREVNGDDALNVNFELVSTPFSVARKGKDNMQILAFFDFGAAYLHTAAATQKEAQYLYSIGPGLRYQFQTNLTARLDWGFQLHHITPQTPHQRLHFQFVGSF
jgi:hemolysin activation/secretion protein